MSESKIKLTSFKMEEHPFIPVWRYSTAASTSFSAVTDTCRARRDLERDCCTVLDTVDRKITWASSLDSESRDQSQRW